MRRAFRAFKIGRPAPVSFLLSLHYYRVSFMQRGLFSVNERRGVPKGDSVIRDPNGCTIYHNIGWHNMLEKSKDK